MNALALLLAYSFRVSASSSVRFRDCEPQDVRTSVLTRSLMFSKSANALSLSSLGPSLSVCIRGSGLPRGS